MTFNSPLWFIAFLVLWLVGGNILAYHMGWHVEGPWGYCSGYGCD